MLADDCLPWRWILSKLLFRWVRPRPSHALPAKREILLYHPTLRRLLDEQRIRELACDILFRPAPMPSLFVRCMNLLNRASFSDPVIRRALDNLRASLTNGGILQFGRTLPGGRNAVSFYRRVGDHLRWLQDVNGGWELRQLLEATG